MSKPEKYSPEWCRLYGDYREKNFKELIWERSPEDLTRYYAEVKNRFDLMLHNLNAENYSENVLEIEFLTELKNSLSENLADIVMKQYGWENNFDIKTCLSSWRKKDG